MRIIPAIDIIDGKCVRLTQGEYGSKKTYDRSPLEIAKELQDYGIQYLHIVDLDGAKERRVINYPVIEKICSQTNLHVDFGGGIKSDRDIDLVFNCGVCQVTSGTTSVQQPDLFLKWIRKYGSDRIILGADARDQKIATSGWTETTEVDVLDFIRDYERRGITQVICTDISKDGMLEGPAFDLYRDIMKETSVKLIASGGVSSMEDVKTLMKMGCEGVVIGKAIYEGQIQLKELRELC